MAELHDVPDDEEVAREAELVDDGEFVFDLREGAFAFFWLAVAVPLDGTGAGQLGEVGHLGVPRWDGEGWQLRGDEPQRKASWSPSDAARSTTPGQRANRAAISAPDRKCWSANAGSHPSISSRVATCPRTRGHAQWPVAVAGGPW